MTTLILNNTKQLTDELTQVYVDIALEDNTNLSAVIEVIYDRKTHRNQYAGANWRYQTASSSLIDYGIAKRAMNCLVNDFAEYLRWFTAHKKLGYIDSISLTI